MDDPLTLATAALERYFDEGGTAALDEACRRVADPRLDIAALLRWLEDAPAEDEPKDRATRRIRAALGLPPMPGAACRPVTFGADGRVKRR